MSLLLGLYSGPLSDSGDFAASSYLLSDRITPEYSVSQITLPLSPPDTVPPSLKHTVGKTYVIYDNISKDEFVNWWVNT